MYNFNEDAIREAAYYIWKNNGCQANTSLSDWDAAINQLAAQASFNLKAPKKAASLKVLMPKKKEVKPASFRSAKSIILKPATPVKASAKKTIVLKASNSSKTIVKKSKKSK